MTKAVIKATFHGARAVPSRGVVTFSFDVPTEMATEALGILGGFPNGGDAVWVAIARLTDEAAHKPDSRERYATASEGEQAVTRAALLCSEEEFQEWIAPRDYAYSVDNRRRAEQSADLLRNKLQITSRAELATNPAALRRFLEIEAQFKSVRQFGPHAGR